MFNDLARPLTPNNHFEGSIKLSIALGVTTPQWGGTGN